MADSSPPRTLADQFRHWSDEELARLLEARPDLAAPAPQDSTQLASRAGTRASVLRAVDHLDLLSLATIDAIVALGGRASLEDLQRHVNAEPSAVASVVDLLRSRALLWGTPDELRSVSVLTEIVGTALSGLGPPVEHLLSGYGPGRVAQLTRDLGLEVSGDRVTDIEAVAARLGDAESVTELVAELDDRARAILDHLERDGVAGAVDSTDRLVDRTTAESPVDQLLARGLVLPRDARHVVVPREVAICLRHGRTTRHDVGRPPTVATSERERGLVDRAAAGAAFEFVNHVELLLEHWGTHPPSALRSGGLGVRDLKAAAELLHVDEATAALHVEVASAADLLAVGDTDELDAAWLPTSTFDVWSAGSTGQQWTALALAWLDSPRLMGLVGTRKEGGRLASPLASDVERAWAAETRRTSLEVLSRLPDDEVLASGTGVPSLVEHVRWLRPRRPSERAEAVAWALKESAVLGITALGGLSTHGRMLLAGDDPRQRAAEALEPLLPSLVDHVLLQADLTAVAPGPLERTLAHNLSLMAEIESRGGATVYRFTAASVRRAFDAGWSAAEVHDFISASSSTPVPQPLVYLVDDVARRFGTVRVGAAGSFLRSDDETALAELVHDPRATALRLRRLAPTVVVSDVPVDVLLPRLRELGTAPVVEAPDGTVRLVRKDTHRARPSRRRGAAPSVTATEARDQARAAARAAATVRAVRAGDRAAASRPASGSAAMPQTPAATMAALRESAETGSTVWIGYLDNHGSTVERVVDPVKVEGGWLTAYDHRADTVRSFRIHRITGVYTESV